MSIPPAARGQTLVFAAIMLGACAHASAPPSTMSWVTQAESTPRSEVLTPHDIAGQRMVSDVELSPDGKWLAYQLWVPRPLDEPGTARGQIWIVDVAGKHEPRRLTPAGKSSWSPRWSPKGDRLAFLSNRPGDEFTQLYAMPVDGGEAEVLFESPSSIAAFEWSPDGKQVAYTSARETDAAKQARETGRDWIVDEAGGNETRLFVHDLKSDEDRELGSDKHVIDFEWSPKGDRLAVRASEQAAVDHVYMYSALYTVDAAGSELKPLTKTAGKLGALAWSPNGERIAFLGAASIHDSTAGIVHVVAAAGGEAKALTPSFAATGTWLDWTDDDELLLLAEQGSQTRFFRLPAAGGEPTPVLTEAPICHDVDLDIGRGGAAKAPAIACAGDSPLHPREAFAGALRGKALRRLTVSNPDLLTRKLGAQSVVDWTAADGLALSGVIIKPVDYQEGTRYPLAVLPHGGPEGVSLNGWNTFATYPAQLFATRGYVVFLPNYRGSAGRGPEFAMADHQDLGGKEFEDVLAGIDHLVAAGLVDGERVGMGGWSYGGYFSGLAATTHSERFKAAMVAAAITDWISFTGTTEIEHENSLVHWKLWPWDDTALPWARSPIAHLSEAKQAKTATLIVHGGADTRVPPGQSTELYRALRHLGVPTQLVIYPREGHGIGENVHGLDFMNRFLDWFDTYVKNAG